MATRQNRPATQGHIQPTNTRSRTTRQTDEEDGESFDFNDVSGESDPDEPVQPHRRATAGAGATQAEVDQQINDPTPVKDSKKAADIHHFFEREGDKNSCKVCKYALQVASLLVFLINITCRKLYDEDPTSWPVGRRFTYSKGTSTTSLRPHIEKYHLEEYERLAKEHGWKIMLPGLVSQARSAATATVSALPDGQPDKFDERTFHEYLLNFIIADDQVYIFLLFASELLSSNMNHSMFQALNIIECPEFRALLLLLRSDLKESMVLHRTKLRELIIEAWRRYFSILKKDLEVRQAFPYCV
jgi:hypothetical protein